MRLSKRSSSCAGWWATRTGKPGSPPPPSVAPSVATAAARLSARQPPILLHRPLTWHRDLISSADTIIDIASSCHRLVDLAGSLQVRQLAALRRWLVAALAVLLRAVANIHRASNPWLAGGARRAGRQRGGAAGGRGRRCRHRARRLVLRPPVCAGQPHQVPDRHTRDHLRLPGQWRLPGGGEAGSQACRAQASCCWDQPSTALLGIRSGPHTSEPPRSLPNSAAQARRYVRASEVHRVLTAGQAKHVAQRFPLLQHQWPLVKKFKPQVRWNESCFDNSCRRSAVQRASYMFAGQCWWCMAWLCDHPAHPKLPRPPPLLQVYNAAAGWLGSHGELSAAQAAATLAAQALLKPMDGAEVRRLHVQAWAGLASLPNQVEKYRRS